MPGLILYYGHYLQGFCDSHNAHLAYIETDAENTFIKQVAKKQFDGGMYMYDSASKSVNYDDKSI